jgi:imidazolonepropionase-like amidohydrolase
VTTTVYRDGALADGRSDRLRMGVSILVVDGVISWIRPSDDEGPIDDRGDVEVIDAGGTTIVPGMVDCHSHLTLPGGSHWIARIEDPVERLLEVAEHNGRLMTGAGVRWARDVGAPRVIDPLDGRLRALSLGVRDRWQGRPGYPRVRAAGTWLDRAGTMPGERSVEAEDADELVALAMGQLDDGADLLKLYLDGPEPGVAPWSADEVARVVAAAHARNAKVTAHSGDLAGARVGVHGGVDAIEHGFELDADIAADMARRGTTLVSTLAVFRSWQTFGATTTIERFTAPERREKLAARVERAEESVRFAHAAGVAIATGTDFGGGSTRANQIAWEVESLVKAGLEPWAALGAATWQGGELLSEVDAGVIREGGPADFILVHGDPLSDPSALWRVWRVAWA